MTEPAVHLLDVNVTLALLREDHIHNTAAEDWFGTPKLRWALCAFTEAGVLRSLMRPSPDELSMEEATAVLAEMKRHPGYQYQPIGEDWHALTQPFRKRLHGHNQVTDAYLLGLAIREGLVLTTFDKALLHMAGEHKKSVLVLQTG